MDVLPKIRKPQRCELREVSTGDLFSLYSTGEDEQEVYMRISTRGDTYGGRVCAVDIRTGDADTFDPDAAVIRRYATLTFEEPT
jgi:hypothetical protein